MKNVMSACCESTVYYDPNQDDIPICMACGEECEVVLADPDYDERGRKRQFLRGERREER